MATGRAWQCSACDLISQIEPVPPFIRLPSEPDFARLPEPGWTFFMVEPEDRFADDGSGKIGHLCPDCTTRFLELVESTETVIHNYEP